MPIPFDWNELDRAIFAMKRSTAAFPDVLRALRQGELCALMPYHPELEGAELELENGMQFPFVMFQEKEGPTVPIFSSEARAEEGLNKGGVAENRFCVATMEAPRMLEVLAAVKAGACVNKSCATGTFYMDQVLIRDLANGKALQPYKPGEKEENVVYLIDPADYPTHIVQPLFETLKKHAAFRAAWILREKEHSAEGGKQYQILVLMNPRDEPAGLDLGLVLGATRKKPDAASIGYVDENDDEYIRYLLERAIPFYAAPDFEGARSLIELE